MDVYKGHGEGDTKWKDVAENYFNLNLTEYFMIITQYIFLIRKHTQNTSCTLFLFIHIIFLYN